MPKTLHLTLKKQWFDMILSGEKKEEYREIKPYWENRLYTYYPATGFMSGSYYQSSPSALLPKDFDTVTFKNGYAADAPEMIVELKRISIEFGVTSWGADFGKKYFVLSLGEILSTKNLTNDR